MGVVRVPCSVTGGEVNAVQLYCQGACPVCSVLARSLTDAGVTVVTHGSTSRPG